MKKRKEDPKEGSLKLIHCQPIKIQKSMKTTQKMMERFVLTSNKSCLSEKILKIFQKSEYVWLLCYIISCDKKLAYNFDKAFLLMFYHNFDFHHLLNQLINSSLAPELCKETV